MTTIAKLIERMMPRGTDQPAAGQGAELPAGTGGDGDTGGAPPIWERLPPSPIDVFAVAGTLVERSGAYRHVIGPPERGGVARAPEYNFDIAELHDVDGPWMRIARAWAMKLLPQLTRSGPAWDDYVARRMKDIPDQGHAFRRSYKKAFTVPYLSFAELLAIDTQPLQALWERIYVDHGDEPVVCDNNAAHGWWHDALRLMILADMACAGVGFRARQRSGGPQAIPTAVQTDVLALGVKMDKERRHLTTLTTAIDPAFCAVLPKTRTASVGCTLRSLSHNLALLPSPGLVEAHWRISGHPPAPVNAPLNLLLVPFPYRIGSDCFSAMAAPGKKDCDWSFFRTDQQWLHKSGRCDDERADEDARAIGRFVADLVSRAAADSDGIHGVIFPEYALDARTFDAIWNECMQRKVHTKLEFIVAGLSEDPSMLTQSDPITSVTPGEPGHGNMVVVRGAKQGNSRDVDFNTSRNKHHRWKLNRSQIERYSLSARLDPGKNWWEAIPLGRRIVEFFEPRAGTSMTVLICEDLARSDPCQTVVRSVGPNLVLALLMDGPQRRFRWPGHYAGVLADDPGSSVLTMTSYGLIARGAAADESQSQSIAFFRNSEGRDRELFLPSGFHALTLSLRAHAKTEHTLDGRGDGGSAYIWSLHDVGAVQLPLNDSNRWVVDGAQ